LAHQRLNEALDRFRAVGAEVEGQVGEVDPLGAMTDVLRSHDFDEIILATLPAGVSKWLRTDLPSRVARAFELPVTHVIVEPPGD
jgi:cobalamin biosynthesis protein CbiD